jgi:hypothetical protein
MGHFLLDINADNICCQLAGNGTGQYGRAHMAQPDDG